MAWGKTVIHFSMEEIKAALLVHAARKGVTSDALANRLKEWKIETVELENGEPGARLTCHLFG